MANKFLLSLFILFSHHLMGQTPIVIDSLAHISSVDYYNYPTPPVKTNRIFFVQRNVSRNIVVYETNFDKGNIHDRHPMNMFWMRYNGGQGGAVAELKWYEKKWIYDIKVHERKPKSYELSLVGYENLKFDLIEVGKDKSEGRVYINNRLAKLDYVFVHEKKGFIKPQVVYLEIGGTDLKTSERIFQRFIP